MRRAMSEFSGVKGRSFPRPLVDNQLPLPEKAIYSFYTRMECDRPAAASDGESIMDLFQ